MTAIVETSDPVRRAVATDFGGMARGTASGVISVTSVEDVVEAVGVARERGSALTIRGTGHSAGGQSLPSDSIVLDMRLLDSVLAADADTATLRCEAGAKLREIVDRTLPDGLLPRPLTNLLDLTVGGIASTAAGVGPGSHKFGSISANIESAVVVTADSEVRWCSRSVEPDLFGAVVGGLGVVGVIVEATLRLRRVKPRVRTYYLLYDDIDRWIADQRALTEQNVDGMEAFCSPAPQGLRGVGRSRAPFVEWFFPMHVMIEYDDDEPSFPEGLAPYRVVHVEDDAISFFPSRHDVRFASMRRTGVWEGAHPYASFFINRRALARILPDVLEATPLSLGDAYRGGFGFNRTGAPPLTPLPASDDLMFFSVMYAGLSPEQIDDAIAADQRIDALLRGAGGRRWSADWLGAALDEAGWRDHFGPAYERWSDARARFDPDGIFASVLVPKAQPVV